ncbi:hypothetical protein B0E43_05610 [Algoriphagus sp. A40]|nr:hypothetical protein B0E43_05610 [Algoriphagus sp. A40]
MPGFWITFWRFDFSRNRERVSKTGSFWFNPDYALEFVTRPQNARKSVTLDPDGYREKSEAQRLILKRFEAAVDFLMHISGFIKPYFSKSV